MTSLDRSSPAGVSVAALVRALASAPVTARDRDAARLRLADTAFAILVGAHTAQGRRAAGLAVDRFGADSVAAQAFRMVAACRMTEIDDMDLESCITPGSVVVPTVLAVLNGLGPAGRLGSAGLGASDAAIDAIVHGYAIALGFGESMRGPERLATGVWPTLTVGGVTAAALTSMLIGASEDDTAVAVALAAEHSIAGNPRGDAREILLAETVVTGIGCALAVRRGFAISGGRGGALAELLTDEPVASPAARVHRPRIKDFCSARQAMTAVSAVRAIVAANGLAPADIDRIDVETPAAYAKMLDKPTAGSRRDSLSSAPYQLALAALDPAGLLDVDRRTLRGDDAFRTLMASVRVHVGDDLTQRYPAAWPARVWIYSGERVFEAVADEVPRERELSAAHLAAKMAALAAAAPGLPADAGDLVERSLRAAGRTDLNDITAFIDGARLGRYHAAPPKDQNQAHAHAHPELTKELLA